MILKENDGLSFLIPNFNRKSCLENLVDSIKQFSLNWGFPVEIIILDGGSKKFVIDYLKSINYGNVKVIFQDNLIGLSRTLEQGLFYVNYKYFTWINNDVEINPIVIEKSYCLLQSNDDIGAVHIRTKNNRNGDIFSAPSHANIGIPLLYGDFSIFRTNAVKKIKINHDFKMLKYLADINLQLLLDGYITVFTKDIGINHLAFEDEERELTFINEKISNEKKEFKVKNERLKNLFYSMYNTKEFKKLGKQRICQINNNFDKYYSFLKKLNYFEYVPYDDFILWQKYPVEFIERWKDIEG